MENKRRLSLRLYFTASVFGILCLTVLVSGLIVFLINYYGSASVTIPTIIWMLMVSIVLGMFLAAYLSDKILSPITKLSRAMSQVAAGDFTVRMESASKINEIRNTYSNFNLMVQELNTTETLQSDFISNVSHEFKTPINAIEGYAMLLQDHQQPPEEQQEYIEKILFNTRRLSELVHNILLLSKVDNQAIPMEESSYRLDEQIRQAVLSLESRWTEKEIDFDVDLEQVVYRGNESLMLHVWTNLIDNAIKFDPHGGVVKLRLKAEAKQIVCTVEDNGPGIPEAAQKHIFDRFYQADGSHKEEGNGLGLALVKRILDVSGGAIHVNSRPECGTTFVVTLPQAH